MESHDNSGKWMFIAHAVCCGGPLLLVLIAGNAALLLSVARSGVFWAGIALLLGSVGFFFIRRRRACQIPPPNTEDSAGLTVDRRPALRVLEARSHD